MPAGLGNVSTRNFVKEFVHKITCGNSLIKTAVINGELFDTTSTTFGGGVNYNTVTTADSYMPANIDVGVLGVTTTVDNMPNNTPGTFRVNSTEGLRKGSVVTIINGAGAVGTAVITHVHRSGSITITWDAAVGAAAGPGSHIVAQASGSPSDAIADTKVSSSAGDSAASGQYIAALLRAFEDVTVSGEVVTPAAAGGDTNTTFTLVLHAAPPPATQMVINAMIGNTITFDDIPAVNADLRGVSRQIISNTATTITLASALPIAGAPIATDTFTLAATQLDSMLNQLMASPGNVDSAGAESANTGAAANNSNVAPVGALAYMASFRFGEAVTGGAGTATEPNLMLTDKVLSDLAGAESLDSFPWFPLALDAGAASTAFSIRIPTSVGDRSIPRSGTLRLQQDSTTAESPALATEPAVNAAGYGFVRERADANGVSVVTLTGGASLVAPFTSGARVFLMTGAMNGPAKHGFMGDAKSADYLSVLHSCVANMLAYTVPAP